MIFALSSTDLKRLGIKPAATITDNKTGRDITLTRTDPTIAHIRSGESTRDITNNLTKLRETYGLLSFNTQNLIHDNLIGLGKASIDISSALSAFATETKNSVNSLVQPRPVNPKQQQATPESSEKGIKDTLTEQVGTFAGALGLSAATASIVLAGIVGFIVLRK